MPPSPITYYLNFPNLFPVRYLPMASVLLGDVKVINYLCVHQPIIYLLYSTYKCYKPNFVARTVRFIYPVD